MLSAADLALPQHSPIKAKPGRLPSVDTLRGLVMVIMALDHTRDFLSNSSAVFDPTDLARTTPLLFFTRWITHFCAPVFVLLAGAGAYLSFARGKPITDLSIFLITRGIWLMFLEIFYVGPIGTLFEFSFSIIFLQVIWVIGVSMVLLGCLIRVFSSRTIGAIGLVMIAVSNLFDGSHLVWLGPLAAPWRFLHLPQVFALSSHTLLLSFYPLIPWSGVLMAGYAAGEILTLDANARRGILLRVGLTATALFLILRAINIYGEPSPWSQQPTAIYTVLSFLRCTKYPPSLLYLLMTLGPALILLAFVDKADNAFLRRIQVFGRVPLFYYVLHFPLIHALAIALSLIAYGNFAWLAADPIGLRRSLGFKGLPELTLTNHGFSLPVVYAAWLGTVILLYPACHWYAGLKSRARYPIFSYL